MFQDHEKPNRLSELLRQVSPDKNNKVLVFVETKKKVDEILRMVKRDGYTSVCIHGDKSQQERDYVLSEFRNGKANVLVATDVAARGKFLSVRKSLSTSLSDLARVVSTILAGPS